MTRSATGSRRSSSRTSTPASPGPLQTASVAGQGAQGARGSEAAPEACGVGGLVRLAAEYLKCGESREPVGNSWTLTPDTCQRQDLDSLPRSNFA